MNVEISKVNASDVEDMYNLMIGYFDFYKKDHPAKDDLLRLISELMSPSNMSTQFIAKINQKPAGFVTLYEVFSTLSCSKIILMNDLYVNPQYRGKGIGKRLFHEALNYTRVHNYKKMEWMTEPSNGKARDFYDKLGGVSSEWIYYSIQV